MNACVTSFHFLVTHRMAPLGRLLVYYVREDGEGVTDSLQFAVKPSFENEVGNSLGQLLLGPWALQGGGLWGDGAFLFFNARFQ